MKRICHITDVHNRYDGRIFQKECSSLAKAEYDTYLVVSDDKSDEIKNGVHIVSTGFVPNGRLERFIKGPKSVYKKAIEIDADLYHLHDPELLTIAIKLKRKGKKVIFDSHEDVSLQLIDAYYIPKFLRGVVSKMYCWYARKKMRKLDAIITVSPHIVDKLKLWNENTVMVTNYPEIKEIGDTIVRMNDKAYVFFAGGVSEQWMHDKIIEAVDKIDSVEYIFAGPAEPGYIEKLKRLPGWRKVTYLGVIDRGEVDKWYAKCICGMTINYCTQLKGTGTLGNNKLFEAMVCSKPVICTDYPLWKEVIEENNCGICVNPHDVNSIANAIKYIYENTDKAFQMGQNGRYAIEREYNWKTQETTLMNLYKSVVG